jgi:hypothetical protein
MPDDTASKIKALVENIESLKNSDEIIRAMQAKTILR